MYIHIIYLKPPLYISNLYHIYLGKSEYFINLNRSAIKGDDSPNPNHHLWVSVAG